jgi:chorismate mutase
MPCRSVRGATTVHEDTPEEILVATLELLAQMITTNGIMADDVASIIFTATPDLQSASPARAARQLGWTQTALLCVQEMAVLGSLPRCIRVLVHWNTTRRQAEIHHVYLRKATQLRPDLPSGSNPIAHAP